MNLKIHRFGVLALILMGLVLGACESPDKSKNEQADASATPDQNAAVPTTPAEPSQAVAATTASRGAIDLASCASGQPIDVDSTAVVALYFDKQGSVVGTEAEDLTATSDKKMCPTPAHSGPGLCQSGYCSQMLSGRKICMPC